MSDPFPSASSGFSEGTQGGCAPGAPGLSPTWCSSAKEMMGGSGRPPLERIIRCAHAPASQLPEGAALTVAVTAPATFRWGFDGWTDICERRTTATELGLHIVEIDARLLKSGRAVDLTYRLEPSGEWAGRDFRISVVPGREAAKMALARITQA